ncbi:hypothetical protein KY335_02410, partial [Candidatus Woesearchaeota archaeon]|nr:hypothetical protein [Candidatus Woesearchaeota archaeon]
MEIEEIKRTQRLVRNTFFHSDRDLENIPEFGDLIRSLPKIEVADLEARLFGTEIRRLARKKKKKAGSIRAHLEKQSLYGTAHHDFILAFEALCSVDLIWLEQDLDKIVEILHADEKLLDPEMVSLKTVLETAGIPVGHELYAKIADSVGEIYTALNNYHSETIKLMEKKSFGSIVWAFQDKKIPYYERLSLLWACIASDNISHNMAAQYCKKEGQELDLFGGRPIKFGYKEKEELEEFTVALIKEVTTYHGNVEDLRSKFEHIQSQIAASQEMLQEERRETSQRMEQLKTELGTLQEKLEKVQEKAARLDELETEDQRLRAELEEAKRKEGEAYELADSCTADLEGAKKRIAELEEDLQDANRWIAIQSMRNPERQDTITNPLLEMKLERKGYDLGLLCSIIKVMQESNGRRLTYDKIKSLVYKAIERNQGRMKKFRGHFSALESQGVFIKEEESGVYEVIKDPNT